MAGQRDVDQPLRSPAQRVVHLTGRQAEVLQLAGRGLSAKQIGRRLGISARTVEDHFSAMRQRTGAHNSCFRVSLGREVPVLPGGWAVLLVSV